VTHVNVNSVKYSQASKDKRRGTRLLEFQQGCEVCHELNKAKLTLTNMVSTM